MCGICGIYNFDLKESADKSVLTKMTRVLNHRGPDDEGFFVSKNVGLGHKRLSIIDLTSLARQPMANEDESVWVTFNGEIYNYLELRKELLKAGHTFKSNSDTEVIVHLYEDYGERFLEKLNGMFAFALYDRKKEKLIIARDRLGIKPVYYYADKRRVIFASEIKAILRCKIKPVPNFSAINDYIVFQFCLGEKTFFKDIKKVLPGHYVVIKNSGIKIKKYWDLDYNIDNSHSEDYFASKLESLLNDSLSLQMRSDVPIGAYLSGGLDSSIVACIAGKSLSKTDFKSFTGAFKEGKEYDETQYSRLVSKFVKAEQNEIYLTGKDFVNIMPKLAYFMDEPAGGPGIFPQYFVSKMAAGKVKVVLGGQGGDEVWGGYARYLVAYLEQALKGAILNNQDEGKYVVTLKSIVPNLGIIENYGPVIRNFFSEGFFGPMDERYFRLIRRTDENVFDADFLKKVKKDNSLVEEFKSIFNYPNSASYFNKMTHFDIKTILPVLLQVEDRASMANSLESRVPLIDHRIVELSAIIPPKIKFKGGKSKYILKKAVKNFIPGKILERKDKIGFAVPLSEWYKKNPVKDFVNETLTSKRAKERGVYNILKIKQMIGREEKFSRTIWGLLCMELWFKTFIDAN